MKIECLLEHINNDVQILARAVSKSNTLSSLQGLLIETKDNKCTITGTNIDTGVSITIPVKTEQEGSVLVNADYFSKVISSIPANEKKITIEKIGDILNITSQKASIKINTLSVDDFPKLPEVTGTTINIQKEILIDGLKSVVFSTANTDIKPEISAVYIYTEPGQIVFVGTDSFRLAEKKIKIKNNEEINVLIPSKNVLEIIRVIDSIKENNITMTYSETMLTLSTDNLYMTSRIVDGTFPDYKRIIPKEVLVETKFLKQDLVQMIKTTNIFSDSFNHITLDIKEKEIISTTKNQSTGSGSYTFPCVSTGGELNMNFNYKYIQDALQIIQKENISFSCTTQQKPIIMRGVGDDSFIYLIMPLNR